MNRRTVSLMAWTLCLPALLPYLLLTLGGIAALSKSAPSAQTGPAAFFVYAGFVAGGGAWALLLWMDLRWVRRKPLHWAWPLLGFASALIALSAFGARAWSAAALASPGIAFAFFLSLWHVRGYFAARLAS